MNKFRNKGTSFVEVVISVVIFGILIIPIVSQMVQSLKSAEIAKEAQTKYELAENLMENVKNSSDFTADAALNNAYITKISDVSKKLPASGTESLSDSSGVDYDGYIVYGTTTLGKKNKKYNYAIVMDNYEYAKKEEDEKDPVTGKATYKNPNTMTLATIEDLDASKVALINGTIGNYDVTVTKAFMSKKLDILKIGDKTRWEQYTKQQADIVAFPNDTVTRVIKIAVKSEPALIKDLTTGETAATTQYTVTCTLSYKENSSVILKDGKYKGKSMGDLLEPIEYVPYEQTFTGELPHIYLMYNPCLYNSNYMKDDYIMIDTSELTTDADVDVFIIETAEQFSDDAAESYAESYKEVYKEQTGKDYEGDTDVSASYLINTDAIRERSEVNVNLFGRGTLTVKKDSEGNIVKDSSGNTLKSPQVTIYSNIFDTSYTETGSTDVKNIKNIKNQTFTYIASHPYDTTLSNCYAFESYQVKKLSEAVEAATSLYNVKIYLTETTLDDSSYSKLAEQLSKMTPIITGTKGGN